MTNLPRVSIDRVVDWQDTDASGHYHHSTVIRWVEAAEAALYEHCGLPVLFGVTPRVHYEVDYLGRLWFRDRVTVTLEVVEVGTSSLRFSFAVIRGSEQVVTGSMTVVNVRSPSEGPTPWSEENRSPRRLLSDTGSRVRSRAPRCPGPRRAPRRPRAGRRRCRPSRGSPCRPGASRPGRSRGRGRGSRPCRRCRPSATQVVGLAAGRRQGGEQVAPAPARTARRRRRRRSRRRRPARSGRRGRRCVPAARRRRGEKPARLRQGRRVDPVAGRPHDCTAPPSTLMPWPLIAPLSTHSRRSSATSSTVTSRPIGCLLGQDLAGLVLASVRCRRR